jgi:uncharacterized protein YjbI with pentapeptide repeats
MTDILQLYSREKLHSIPAGTLAGADLTGAQLSYADLRGRDLRGAVLRDACLYGANLNGADLAGADLTNADIFLAHFQEADLRGANFQGARLAMAQFTGARIDSATQGMSVTEATRMGMTVCYELDALELEQDDLRLPCAPLAAPVQDGEALPVIPPQSVPTPVLCIEAPRKPERGYEHSELLQRATVRKEGKKVAYLATLTTARASAALVSISVAAYTLAPPSFLASLRLHESPTWVYAAAYYLVLAVGSYLLAAPLRDRWYGDSGLPY